MRRVVAAAVVVTAVLLLAGAGAANGSHGGSDHNASVKPGVTPDSPFYGFDVALDNLLMGLGVASPGDVAAERASEAKTMVKQNKTKEAQTALDNLNAVAQRATSDDTAGLETAKAILEEIKRTWPAGAHDAGLDRALANVDEAFRRVGGGVADGSCQADIAAAKNASAGQVCTQQVKTLVCPDDSNVTYRARDGCQISYLQGEGWTAP